jgi:hypothetical protein
MPVLFGGLGTAGLLLGAVAVVAYVLDPPRPEEISPATAFAAIAFFFLLGAVGVAIAVYTGIKNKVRIVLCPGGIVHVRRSGCKIFRWDEIDTIETITTRYYIYFVIPAATGHVVRICHEDGAVIKITEHFGDVLKIRKQIERECDRANSD